MTQKFKGDATELKMIAAAEPAFNVTSVSLDEFYSGGFDCAVFLLMLYDQKRMPFSERVNRATFVSFIKQALLNFPVTGTFEAYLFVLRAVFGELSEIFFDVPSPGKLSIEVNAVASLVFDFIVREFVSGAYVFFELTDDDGNILEFRGITGIDNQYQLSLLFSELMPIGITPDIALTFYTYSTFISDELGLISEITDDDNNNILFREIGA